MNYTALSYSDLLAPAALILINGALSLRLRLGVERQLIVAALRMVAQLSLAGFVLTLLFRAVSPFWTGLAAAVMVLFAGREIAARQSRKLIGGWSFGLGTLCALTAAGSLTALTLVGPIAADPWYHPRYALPLLGMILGNTLTGISLGLDVLTNGAVRQRAAIEAQLALGASRWTALLPVTRDAIRSGLIPTINTMAAIGIVSLPGMMTGQILAGVAPVDAVKYQILIMFVIAGATAFGTLMAVAAAVFLITDDRHRMRLDRLG
ncbi:iron export ABC transporter permease subunit FetB [uncultured Sphingomonas sp.]|uniref:ABC transporter permease n=1 Tax=uncultured Sphingomonas sp. TaxID=158754 RepID=UPI0025E74AD1|nr:iron export ABC transporter permease subunit FetB [uncultured Sphingomonas sp.]